MKSSVPTGKWIESEAPASALTRPASGPTAHVVCSARKSAARQGHHGSMKTSMGVRQALVCMLFALDAPQKPSIFRAPLSTSAPKQPNEAIASQLARWLVVPKQLRWMKIHLWAGLGLSYKPLKCGLGGGRTAATLESRTQCSQSKSPRTAQIQMEESLPADENAFWLAWGCLKWSGRGSCEP